MEEVSAIEVRVTLGEKEKRQIELFGYHVEDGLISQEKLDEELLKQKENNA